MSPRKLTPELSAKFCALIEGGRTVADSAREVGVAESTIHAWAKAGSLDDAEVELADFYLAYKAAVDANAARPMTLTEVEMCLQDLVRSGSLKATEMMLLKLSLDWRIALGKAPAPPPPPPEVDPNSPLGLAQALARDSAAAA